MISEFEADHWKQKGYQVTELGYPQEGYDTLIAFTKVNARDLVTSEVVIGSTLSTIDVPCYGFDSDRLVLTPD